MKKYILLPSLLMILLVACESKKTEDTPPKTYTYQIVMEEVNNGAVLVGEESPNKEWVKDPDTIRVANDTTAYLKAYGRLCSYKLFYATLNDENSPKSVLPQKFILKNSAGKDVIETLDMPNRKQSEDRVWQSTLEFEKEGHQKDSIKLNRIEKAVQPRF